MTSSAAKLAEAVQVHQAGNLVAAEQIYREVLAYDPNQPDALHLLGMVALATGSPERAKELISKAIRVRPQAAPFHSNLALAVMELGDLPGAEASCREAIRLNPVFPEAHYNLSVTLQRRGLVDEAMAACREALSLQPKYPRAHFALGVSLWERGDLEEAIASLKQAVALDERYVEAHDRLGVALRDHGQLEDAERACQRALAIREDYVQAKNTLGTIALRREDYPVAVQHFREAIQRKPDFLEAHNNLSIALKELGLLESAAEACRKAIECQPDSAEAHSNLGSTLRQQGKIQEAIAECEKAISLQHELADGHCNLGAALHEEGDLDGAKERYLQAIQLDHKHADSRKNLSMILLAQGAFAQGWEEYEWRWPSEKPGPCRHPGPRWDGQSFAGQTLLVFGEQGFGDTLQFIRYLKLVKERGGEVIFVCKPKLLRILQGVAGIDYLVARGSNIPPYHYQIPLLSLPRLFGTDLDSIPGDVPYLAATPEKLEQWQPRIHQYSGRRVGIFWQGSPTFARDLFRSVPLEHYLPLAEIPGISLLSFQKGHGIEQLQELKNTTIPDIGTGFEDFTDTAAALKSLDLFVTSDTAVAHLAGSLGVPTWVALGHVPDWRWLLDRSDSPWYPSMRLFRQKQRGDWPELFGRIASELREWSEQPIAELSNRIDVAQANVPHQMIPNGVTTQP